MTSMIVAQSPISPNAGTQGAGRPLHQAHIMRKAVGISECMHSISNTSAKRYSIREDR